MIDGSYDIPAIKFYIVCFTDEALGKMVSNKDVVVRRSDIIIPFENVDGLSLGQILDIFNNKSRNKKILFTAMIDTSQLMNDYRRNLHMLFYSMCDANNNVLLDLEVSDAFEQALIASIPTIKMRKGITTEQIAATFCTRYRGRDEDYIKKRFVKSKEQ